VTRGRREKMARAGATPARGQEKQKAAPSRGAKLLCPRRAERQNPNREGERKTGAHSERERRAGSAGAVADTPPGKNRRRRPETRRKKPKRLARGNPVAGGKKIGRRAGAKREGASGAGGKNGRKE